MMIAVVRLVCLEGVMRGEVRVHYFPDCLVVTHR